MNGKIRSVTVYCSSSRSIDAVYLGAARELGAAIARAGWKLVYGGNDLGSMGALADAARAAGGKVIGITPKLLVDEGLADRACDELIVTHGMRERKALLESHGNAFIALPGGLGTMEELFEILVARSLRLHDKPIVLVNIEQYYSPLLALFDHAIERKFMNPRVLDHFHAAASSTEAIEWLQQI